MVEVKPMVRAKKTSDLTHVRVIKAASVDCQDRTIRYNYDSYVCALSHIGLVIASYTKQTLPFL